MRVFLLAGFLLLLALPARAQVVRGTVVDAETGAALARAHVRIVDTATGAVANDEGRFALPLPTPADSVRLLVRHLGYATQTLAAAPGDEVTIYLAPAPIQMEDVFVTGDHFAEGLMRRVLDQKATWHPEVETVAAEGFTRMALYDRDRTLLLADAAFHQYDDRERGARSVVHAYSETAAWHRDLPLPFARPVPSFYADRVPLHGLSFVGPTHPDALEVYVFNLQGRRKVGERVVYDLFVAPRDERLATLVGRLSVEDETYAVLEVELRPARHVTFPPPVASWHGGYVQQFAEVEGGAWLPVGLRGEGTLVLQEDARRQRRLGVRWQSVLSDHRVNAPLPEAPFAQDAPYLLDDEVVWNDPHFIEGRALLPLTEEDETALARLRRDPPTLREAFPPEEEGGRLATFLRPGGEGLRSRLQWPVVMGYRFRFRYNRVDGLYSSVGQDGTLGAGTEVAWRLGQATGLRRVRASARVRQALGDLLYVEAGAARDVVPQATSSRYPLAATSLQAALGGPDYFDYAWRQGYLAEVGAERGRLRAALRLEQSDYESVDRQVARGWPVRDAFAPNPALAEGRLHAARATLAWALPEQPYGLPYHAEASVERGVADGDIAYTRFAARAEARVPTLLRRRPVPAELRLLVTGSASTGTLPPQRYAAVDGSLSFFDAVHVGRWGTLRTVHGRPLAGKAHVLAAWEHRFQTLPFEVLRLWPLVHRGTGLAVYGVHARTWQGSFPGTSATVHELGAALTRVGGTPLRLDATVRLDRPGVYLGLGWRW